MVLAAIANPNTDKLAFGNVHLLPVNLYIYGDTFYYLLYALAGRAIGMMEARGRAVGWLAALGFALCVALIARGTKHQLFINGNFADTYYIYSGPLVFMAAVALLVWVKHCLPQPIGWLSAFSRHSLAIYGFHALIVNVMRSRHRISPATRCWISSGYSAWRWGSACCCLSACSGWIPAGWCHSGERWRCWARRSCRPEEKPPARPSPTHILAAGAVAPPPTAAAHDIPAR